MKKYLINFLVLVILISTVFLAFAREKLDKQKSLIESYIGRWRGNVTSKNINRAGGWSDKFLGYHEISKEEVNLYFNVRFLHPFDDPSIKEYKKLGYPVEFIKGLKNLMPIPDELKIIGYAILSGFTEYTHETKEYCEECAGKDGTSKKDFPGVVISVSGRINIVENNIDFDFNDMPEGYNSLTFLLGEPKLIAPDKIEFNFKNFEEPNAGVYALEQLAKGELHRIYIKKDTLGKTVHINKPIKTDEFTQRDIVIPAVIDAPEFPYKTGELYVFNNTNCVFTSKNELYLETGEIVVLEDRNWWKEVDINKIVSEANIPNKDLSLEIIMDEIKISGSTKVQTPQAGGAVRGTQFITKVEKDGTTSLTVLDGEVEFSDKQMRKTVLVKKNQKSVVKPNGLPTEPVSIDSNQIPRWWK